MANANAKKSNSKSPSNKSPSSKSSSGKSSSSKSSSGQQNKSQGSSNALDKEVAATLKRLQTKDPGLKQLVRDAYGYAVFPTVGKAALLIGGAYGRGQVFERGKLVGYATI